jgi:hypothetical protein
MPLLLRQCDEIGEQDEAVRKPAAPERDDEPFAVSAA